MTQLDDLNRAKAEAEALAALAADLSNVDEPDQRRINDVVTALEGAVGVWDSIDMLFLAGFEPAAMPMKTKVLA